MLSYLQAKSRTKKDPTEDNTAKKMQKKIPTNKPSDPKAKGIPVIADGEENPKMINPQDIQCILTDFSVVPTTATPFRIKAAKLNPIVL